MYIKRVCNFAKKSYSINSIVLKMPTAATAATTVYCSTVERVSRTIFGFVLPIIIVLLILLFVWMFTGPIIDYNPFEHDWIAYPLSVGGILGLVFATISWDKSKTKTV